MSETKNAVVVGKVDLNTLKRGYGAFPPLSTPQAKLKPPKKPLGKQTRPQKAKVPEKPATQSQMLAELQYVKKQVRAKQDALNEMSSDFLRYRELTQELVAAYERGDAAYAADLKLEMGLA